MANPLPLFLTWVPFPAPGGPSRMARIPSCTSAIASFSCVLGAMCGPGQQRGRKFIKLCQCHSPPTLQPREGNSTTFFIEMTIKPRPLVQNTARGWSKDLFVSCSVCWLDVMLCCVTSDDESWTRNTEWIEKPRSPTVSSTNQIFL